MLWHELLMCLLTCPGVERRVVHKHMIHSVLVAVEVAHLHVQEHVQGWRVQVVRLLCDLPSSLSGSTWQAGNFNLLLTVHHQPTTSYTHTCFPPSYLLV